MRKRTTNDESDRVDRGQIQDLGRIPDLCLCTPGAGRDPYTGTQGTRTCFDLMHLSCSDFVARTYIHNTLVTLVMAVMIVMINHRLDIQST